MVCNKLFHNCNWLTSFPDRVETGSLAQYSVGIKANRGIMKKAIVILSAAALVFAGCSRKAVPAKTKPGAPVTIRDKAAPLPATETAPVTETAPPAVNTTGMGMPLVVIDGSGNIITSKDKLPQDIALKTNYATMARAFTPGQKKNLVYRFKMIPPKVLYVPEAYVSKSARGKYIVYRKKFWYWQKADGLFYLDNTYYQ